MLQSIKFVLIYYLKKKLAKMSSSIEIAWIGFGPANSFQIYVKFVKHKIVLLLAFSINILYDKCI